jgi:hypothetical protein
MYSFAQRKNCRVIDEPLYAYYLKKTGLAHPGREEILKSMSSDSEFIIKKVLLSDSKSDEIFIKNMAHHFVGLPWNILGEFKNVFLIREPGYVIESYIKQIDSPVLSDLGYDLILRMTDHLTKLGIKPFVIDTRDILSNPENALRAICKFAGISFEESMLKWQAGSRPEDGVWAPYWYKNVHISTGFQPYEERDFVIPKRLHPLLEECQEIYEILKGRSIFNL